MFRMTKPHISEKFPGYEKIKSTLNESPDLECRMIEASKERIQIIFMKNLIKPEILNEFVIKYIEELSVESLQYTYLTKNIPIEEINEYCHPVDPPLPCFYPINDKF